MTRGDAGAHGEWNVAGSTLAPRFDAPVLPPTDVLWQREKGVWSRNMADPFGWAKPVRKTWTPTGNRALPEEEAVPS